MPTASGRPNHHHRSITMTSPQSRSRYGQTGFRGSSALAHLGDRSFASPSGTHIANSRNDNTATRPFGFSAGPSSHSSMSIEANGSMAALSQSISTYQSNDALIDTPARPKFSTDESMPFTRNDDIPVVPAPSSRNTYTRPPTNMNQYTGYSSHDPPSLHSSQYRNTVPRDILLQSGSLQVPYVPQHLSPNADLAPPNSYPQSFTHDFGTQCGSQSAGPPYQPLPSMAHSQSPALTGFWGILKPENIEVERHA